MKTASLVLLVLGIGLGTFSVVALVPTVMLFDDGKIENKLRWVVFTLWLALPLLCAADENLG